jgi:hypothetical protein
VVVHGLGNRSDDQGAVTRALIRADPPAEAMHWVVTVAGAQAVSSVEAMPGGPVPPPVTIATKPSRFSGSEGSGVSSRLIRGPRWSRNRTGRPRRRSRRHRRGCGATVSSCPTRDATTTADGWINVGVLGGVRHAQRLCGPFLAKRMFETGEYVSADEIYRRGGIEAVVEPDQLIEDRDRARRQDRLQEPDRRALGEGVGEPGRDASASTDVGRRDVDPREDIRCHGCARQDEGDGQEAARHDHLKTARAISAPCCS